MANAINDRLAFDPGDFTDPVPPWFLVAFLDRIQLRDFAIVQIERARAINDANAKALDKARDILKGMK